MLGWQASSHGPFLTGPKALSNRKIVAFIAFIEPLRETRLFVVLRGINRAEATFDMIGRMSVFLYLEQLAHALDLAAADGNFKI